MIAHCGIFAANRTHTMSAITGKMSKTRWATTEPTSVAQMPRRPGSRRVKTATRASSPMRPGNTAFAKRPTPNADRTPLSTSIWRTRRPRDAPSDKRTASSFCRMNARAMSRLATLAQAMSSTSPTMAMSTMRAVEKSLRSCE